MIEITPAILTADAAQFSEIIERYLGMGFNRIDIDIADSEFAHHDTLQMAEVLPLLENLGYEDVEIGWHLMLKHPQDAVVDLMSSEIWEEFDHMIYIHQEAEIGFIKEADFNDLNLGVVVKENSALKGPDFYNKFLETQLMTVTIGAQGDDFNTAVLNKIDQLRSMGYVGVISLDGGVNLQSALIIVDCDIDRVSVGSFLQDSKDPELDYQKLNLALNLRPGGEELVEEVE